MTPRRGGRRDARLIYAAAFVRSAIISLIGVIVAIHLAGLGFSITRIGVVIGCGLAGSALATLLVSLRADAWGRRRMLVAFGVLSATGYTALALASDIAILLPLAFLGMLNGMGRDRGGATALEQAILPDTTAADGRTWALAWYNVVLDCGHALGALAGATPVLLSRTLAIDTIAAHRLTFLFCAGVTLVGIVPYLGLSTQTEFAPAADAAVAAASASPETRRVVRRLAVLFGLDSIGGGFLNTTLIAYWFFRRYGTSEAELALLFFAARALNAVSHVGAAWLARRIGLLNTMVWTHLPSSVFLMIAPVAPTATAAAALFLAREALVEMDVPTRQSYVMAVVPRSARTFASGITNVTRTVGWAVGPSVAGAVMQHAALGGPLIIGGTLKIAYDVLLYRSFRHVRPPEETPASRDAIGTT